MAIFLQWEFSYSGIFLQWEFSYSGNFPTVGIFRVAVFLKAYIYISYFNMYSEVKIEGLVIRGMKELREKRRKRVIKRIYFIM